MALQAGCTTVTIMDVDGGRVDFATDHKFATHGYKVPCHSPQLNSVTNTPSSSGSSTPETNIMNSFADIEITNALCTAKALAKEVLSLTQNTNCSEDDEDVGVDCTFECTGKEACMQTALYATRPGGRVIMVGMGTPIQTLPMSASHLREVDILGIFRYCNTYAAGIKLLESGRLPNLDDMVTHTVLGLANAVEAFELAGRTKADDGKLVLKVVIKC
jgi:L-iditol 2-dehydrogenase